MQYFTNVSWFLCDWKIWINIICWTKLSSFFIFRSVYWFSIEKAKRCNADCWQESLRSAGQFYSVYIRVAQRRASPLKVQHKCRGCVEFEFLWISLLFSESLYISLNFSVFPYISLPFSSFNYILLHFSAFLGIFYISLHFYMVFFTSLCISLILSE